MQQLTLAVMVAEHVAHAPKLPGSDELKAEVARVDARLCDPDVLLPAPS